MILHPYTLGVVVSIDGDANMNNVGWRKRIYPSTGLRATCLSRLRKYVRFLSLRVTVDERFRFVLIIGFESFCPNAPRPWNGPFLPHNLITGQGHPVLLLQLKMAPRLRLLMSPGSKKEEPRCVSLSVAKALHSHRTWAEVFFCSTPPTLRAIGQPH